MIIDASALIAILTREQDAHIYADAVAGARSARLGAATYAETAIVLQHRGGVPPDALDSFLDAAEVRIVPFTATHARLARDVYRRFGRGTGSPAGLNFGACLTYALARAEDEPLLFKGEDFTHTDVRSALSEPDR